MDMQSDGSNVSDVLHLLESQPERLQVYQQAECSRSFA